MYSHSDSARDRGGEGEETNRTWIVRACMTECKEGRARQSRTDGSMDAKHWVEAHGTASKLLSQSESRPESRVAGPQRLETRMSAMSE